MTKAMDSIETVGPSSNSALDTTPYYPALDGLRAFSVLFVMYEHVTILRSPLSHFHGWLGVDIFFVLSGFLITGLLAREERRYGSIDMVAFYIRRAFRILPLYWTVLSVYVLMLLPAANHVKWAQMKIALPYFLTFNNEIPLLFMPQRVGTIFGLSWTLGIEEKFYILWPCFCLLCFKSSKRRLSVGFALYGMTIVLSFLSFKICRAYSGLTVGALLALLLSSQFGEPLKKLISKIPPSVAVLATIAAFGLVDLNIRFVFLFSWVIALVVAIVALYTSWLSKGLSNPALVWIGKRSYAMYLIQGFGMQFLHKFFLPRTPSQEVFFTFGSFAVACLGAALLRVVVEEPARRLGKAVIAKRQRKLAITELPIAELPNEQAFAS
jgi:peptidoglycan/LPS O-acetylase OafA/YrhL